MDPHAIIVTMTFRMYIIFMCLATLLSWAGWGLVIWNMDPSQVGIMGFLLFYVTLGMALLGSLTLLGVVYRVVFLQRQTVLIREVRVAFRHGVLVSLLGVGSLALSGVGSFRWWIILLFIGAVSALEYFFLIGEESRRV